MFFIVLLMLLAPGLISFRILYSGKTISKSNYKYIVCDYLVYSFLIVLVVYAVMFFSYPERTVSLSIHNTDTHSQIYSASFILKYSLMALTASVLLPIIVPKLYRVFLKLEKNKRKWGVSMYLDPGFGSMIIQFLVAGIAVGGIALAMLRKRIAALFRRKSKSPINSVEGKTAADDGFEEVDWE